VKSLFKNASVYRMLAPIETFEPLQDLPPSEPAGSQVSKIGWGKPLSESEFADPYFHISTAAMACAYTMLRLVTVEKKLKPAAIKRAVSLKAKQIEAKYGYKVGRKGRLDIRDEVVMASLPAAMPEESSMCAYIDHGRDLLIVDTASNKKADDFTAALREALGSLRVVPMQSVRAPDKQMHAWVKDDSQPGYIELQGDAIFKNPQNLSQTANIKHCDIDGQTIQGVLEEGMIPQELALQWKVSESSSISFTITDEIKLKRISFSDDLIEIDESYEDAEQQYAASMLINCRTISAAAMGCVQLFGGVDSE